MTCYLVTDSTVEQAVLIWLKQEAGYVVHGPDIAPDTSLFAGTYTSNMDQYRLHTGGRTIVIAKHRRVWTQLPKRRGTYRKSFDRCVRRSCNGNETRIHQL